jgi:hypothetical protein
MLSASIGARTGYFHASDFLVIKEPTLTVIIFSLLAIGVYQLSNTLGIRGRTAKCKCRNERECLTTGWDRLRENATPPRPDDEAVKPRSAYSNG